MKNPNMPAIPMRKPLVNLNNSRGNGSPLRRSILIATTPVINETRNNDEAERLQRRTNAEMQRRISSVSLNRSITTDNSELSESKMQDHFQQCVRLFAENKINSKNAWNLQIIEYLRKLLDREQFETGDSLQMASTSLDIGSKVYGLRVDDIHNDIMKLASNMARINLEPEQLADAELDAEGAESDNEDTEAQKKAKEKKRKKRTSIGDENCQLVSNEATITGTVPTTTFYNRSDSGTQRLYTLSAMRTRQSGDEQLVSCRSKLPYWCPLPESLNVRPLSGLVTANIPPANGKLCPSFTDFIVDEWEPEDELQAVPAHGDEVVYDEEGFPVPELDRSLNNFDDGDQDQLSDVEEELGGEGHRGEANPEVAHITDMRPGPVGAQLEYSYREPPVISERYMLTGVWAGPSHWKVKCVQRTATATLVRHPRVVRKRAVRAPVETIDFHLDEEQYEQLVKLTRSRFVKALMEEYRITYPEDMKITQREIRSLFLKPDVYVSAASDTGSRVDQNITNYEYDNPNDAEYCNDTLQGDALDVDSDSEPAAPPSVANDSCFDHMVAVPTLVQKSQVPYATQAKKVDMKKLKRAIIRTVAKLDVQNAHVNDDDEALDTCKFSKVSFCKMYEALPLQLNSRMAEEVSCPLAFVALLHLCNERSLRLDGQEDLLDVLISSE